MKNTYLTFNLTNISVLDLKIFYVTVIILPNIVYLSMEYLPKEKGDLQVADADNYVPSTFTSTNNGNGLNYAPSYTLKQSTI